MESITTHVTIEFTAFMSTVDILAVVITESLTGFSARVNVVVVILVVSMASVSTSMDSLSIVSGVGVVVVVVIDSGSCNRRRRSGISLLLLALLSVVLTELSAGFQGVTAIATNNATTFTFGMTSDLLIRINKVLNIVANRAVADLISDWTVTDWSIAKWSIANRAVANRSVTAETVTVEVTSSSSGMINTLSRMRMMSSSDGS